LRKNTYSGQSDQFISDFCEYFPEASVNFTYDLLTAVQLGDNSEQVVEAISKPANDTKCGSCYGAETDELP
jgi:hypothetical protein